MAKEKKSLADLTAGTYEGNKIPKLTKFIYPWMGIFRDACYALVGTFLLQYTMTAGVLSTDAATYTAQMNVITVALIIALIWDGLNDPIMGLIIEKVHFKTGKFRPWILIGGIGNAVVVMLMFAGFAKDWAYVGMMIFYYFMWDLVFTMNDIGYWSMLPSLTSDEKERSSITTKVTLATTIGAFAMNIIVMLLSGTQGVGLQSFYRWASIIVAVLFLVSQTLIFFLCKERARDPKQEEVSSKTKFSDLFTIVKKNKPLLMVVIAMLLYYISSALLTGSGLNYFYFAYGYGGNKGGLLASLLSVFFVIATIVAQALYPMIAKKWKKQTILTFTFGVSVVAYVIFLLIAFPLFGDHPLAYSDFSNATDMGSGIAACFSGTAWLLFIPSIFFFAAQGIFYLCLLVMMQNAIEYNEWKFGERKESVVFAWRPLDAKFSSAILKGIQNLMYMIAGLYDMAVLKISNAEGQLAADTAAANGDATAIAAATATRDSTVAAAMANIKPSQLVVFGCILIGLILIIYGGAWACLHFGYKIDEEQYKKIVDELEVRHKADEAAAGATVAQPAPAEAAPKA
jgi:Na+/melibiose symporter-like transporter